jgi:DNA (cytosine-5)-methyltransferase 1
MTIKILNLYAGIGGNRKLWGGDMKVVAVENNPEIASIYQDFFPNDEVVVADAHQYLLEHYHEFDFIWSSPPCPTHSRLRKVISMNSGAKAVYPDMKLYEEILFLEGYFEGKWVVENVISWYNPLIKPYELERHYFWSNFVLPKITISDGKIELCNGYHQEDDKMQCERLAREFGYDLSKYDLTTMKARTMLRNCVNPKTGKHIYDFAFKHKQHQLFVKDIKRIP